MKSTSWVDFVAGNQRRGVLAIAATWLCANMTAFPAQAQIPPGPEPTVVTVTAQAMPLSATSASVTILSRDYIESSGAETAADLLRSTPFVQVAQSGASGGLTTISIRGAKSDFTLVMIDGIPVNDITNLLGGAFDFSSLPIDNIERVEIVRGPLSSVYGSDAIGGVINFISRKGSKTPVIDASGELGSFLQRQFKLDTSGTWKALQYSAGGSWLDVGQQVLDDAYSVGSLSFNGSVALGPNRVLDFTARWLDDQSAGFPAGSGGPELAILRQPMSDHAIELVLGASFKGQIRPWWLYSFDLDRVNRTDNNFTPAVLDRVPPTADSLPSSTSYTDFTRVRGTATSRFILPDNLSFSLSAGVHQEDGSNTGFLEAVIPQAYRISRTSLLAGSEIEYSTEPLTVTAGFSFDKTNGYGEVTSPRLGLSWTPLEHGPRFKTSWAKGFKLPSFYSLANPSVGNPSLEPERANSFDAGIEHGTRVRLSLTYFQNDFRDLVNFDTVTFRLMNMSRTLTQGAELGADYAATAKVHFGLDFSYTTWNLFDSTQPLRNVPHGNGGIHLDWKFNKRFRARAETQWMGRRYDYQIPVPSEDSVGGYSSTNLSANYEINPKVMLFLRGDNLFDSKYHEYIGFPNPGVAIRVGVLVNAFGN